MLLRKREAPRPILTIEEIGPAPAGDDVPHEKGHLRDRTRTDLRDVLAWAELRSQSVYDLRTPAGLTD